MFTDKTLYESSVLAKDLTSRGILLKCQSETLLYDLLSVSYPIGSNFADQDSLLKEIQEVTEIKDLDGLEKHSALLNQFSWGLKESLNSIMSLARNDVNPIVKEAVCEIDKNLNDGLERNAGIIIKPIFQPDILKNGNLDDLISRYTNNDYTEVHWKHDDWPSLDYESLKNYAKGKSRSLDSQIDAMMDDLEDEVVVSIYDNVFRLMPLPENVSTYEEVYVSILSFLWASSWLIEPPEGVNLPLSQLSMSLTNLKSNSAKTISGHILKFERLSAQRNFILKMPNLKTGDKVYLVQGEIYNKWLEDGGSPELLIGSYFCNKEMPLNDISEEKKLEYLRQYRLETDMRRQEYEIKKNTIITKTLSDFVDRKIDSLNADRTIVRQRFNEKISNWPYSEKIDLAYWVRKVICKTFFPTSEALTVLNDIDDILNANPEMNPREAATLSAIKMVSDWLYSLIKVELVPC